jgi:hypothetical protein
LIQASLLNPESFGNSYYYIRPESEWTPYIRPCCCAYELLCFAQQDLKIVHYYYPALPLLSSIACNAAAMLQDSGRMYELLPIIIKL